jgi:hypothetical protein
MDGRRCFRQFAALANCETRIELDIPDEKTGTTQKQVAYAPFLFANRHTWGPLVRSICCHNVMFGPSAFLLGISGCHPDAS